MPPIARIACLRLTALVLLVLMAGCSSLPRQTFTEREQAIAQPLGMRDIRVWGDASPKDLRAHMPMEAMFAYSRKVGSMDMLALSGGASDGAFGAGVLIGLSQAGARPQFTFVSGVSAGALIAPLAFLGRDYDKLLGDAFTDGRAAPLGEGGVLSILFSQESRRAALFSLVESIVDERMLRSIADEHARGRRLLVVTTNADAQRPVVWDMGAIAASRHPNALSLFRNVLTASSSIPGAFAPTLIEVEADGRRFSEMHVDGGLTTQVFTVPEGILASGGPHDLPVSKVPSRIFIVINNRLQPDFSVVEGSALPLAGRSLSTLIKTHSRLTLVATQEFARNKKIGFNLTYIDDGFPKEPKPSFETPYMRAVFEYGRRRALSGRLWTNSVPFPGQSYDQGQPLLASRR